jgi:hypothetical protein
MSLAILALLLIVLMAALHPINKYVPVSSGGGDDWRPYPVT